MEESSTYISKVLLTLQKEEDKWNQESIKTCMKIVDQALNHSNAANTAVEKIYQVEHWLINAKSSLVLKLIKFHWKF